MTESSKTNNQKKTEIKRKADKMSRIHRTLSLVTFWTIIQTAVPKNIRAAKMIRMMRRSLAFHFINAWQPFSGRKNKNFKS